MEWLNVKQFSDAIGIKSRRLVIEIMKGSEYKGIPLKTKFEKSPRGQMQKLVLWETNNSQLKEIVPATPKVLPQAVSVQTGGSFLGGIGEVDPVYLQSEAAGNPVFSGENNSTLITHVVESSEQTSSHFEDESEGKKPLSKEQLLENLINYKCHGKDKNAAKQIRHRYRKYFAQTGKLPPAAFADDGRKGMAGRKNNTPADIELAFKEMVVASADKSNPKTFRTQSLRKITEFQCILEKRFKQEISYRSLLSIVRRNNLKKYLLMPDDELAKGEKPSKEPSYWRKVNVGQMFQMDGCTSDFIEILIDGKYRVFTWIEFYDVGSRRLMAMDVYSGETNKNSVDIFNKLLMNNRFPLGMNDGKGIDFRPDNGKSFLNLRRCFKQINDQHAVNGFFIVDNFARPLEAKDKAHLERTHRTLHNFELQIIEHFKDRIVGTRPNNKNMAGKGESPRYKKVTVTQLDITLDELRESGLIQEYVERHNNRRGQFTVEGERRSWIPEVRWQEYLAGFDSFARFAEADFERNRIQGFIKIKGRSVSKTGSFVYNGQTYFIDKAIEDKFSRMNPTKVVMSDIGNGEMALFHDAEDGVFIGKAFARRGSAESQKSIDKREQKVIKIKQGGEFAAIKTQLEEYNVKIDEIEINRMIEEGLTVGMTTEILANNNAIRYDVAMSPNAKLKVFGGAFKAKKNAEATAKMGLSVINGGNRG